MVRTFLGGLVGVFIGLGVVAVAQAQGTSATDCPNDTMDDMGWWVLFPILFGIFLLVAIFRMLVGENPLRMMGLIGGPSGDGEGSAETPLQAAQRRYANGEIDREEFQRIRDDLG